MSVRVEHKSGAAVWEVWRVAPPQLVDPVRWTGWLDTESAASIARRVWERLLLHRDMSHERSAVVIAGLLRWRLTP